MLRPVRRGLKPRADLRLLRFAERQRADSRRAKRWGNLHARVAQRRQVQRLTDAVGLEQIGREQLVRAHVRRDTALAHEHDAVDAAPEHVLEPVLNDDDRRARLPLNLVDQLDRLPAGRGVEVGQRLVKQQHLNLIDHHARQAHALLLPAGELMRRGLQVVCNVHQPGHARHSILHLPQRRARVFQREGDVLAHRQADKLSVRVLQHRSYMRGQLKDARPGRVHAVDRQFALDLAGKGKRNQAVDAAAQRALAAAGGPGDQHALTRQDVKIDPMERRPLLRTVLEREIPEGYDRLSHGFILSAQPLNCTGLRVFPSVKKGRVAPAHMKRWITPRRGNPCPRWSCCTRRTAARRSQRR